MSRKTTFTDEQIKEIIRLYIEERMGTPSIATVFNTHKTIIARTLRENNIQLDQPGRRNTGGKKAADKRYYSKNKEDIKEYYKDWAINNRENLREYHTEWRNDNRKSLRERQSSYEKIRRAEDPRYRLAARTRTAVWTCLKEANVAKYRSTFETLGFTLEELMGHLEKQFVEGMTWENYGEWHVDHKIPMARFNFTSVEDPEFRLCWCLENLQPLWGPDNLSKGARFL
jgi:hypothetical protein